MKLYLIILLNRPPKSSAEEHDPNFLLRSRKITISVFKILIRLSVLGTGRHPSLDAKDKQLYLLHVKIGFFLILLQNSIAGFCEANQGKLVHYSDSIQSRIDGKEGIVHGYHASP